MILADRLEMSTTTWIAKKKKDTDWLDGGDITKNSSVILEPQVSKLQTSRMLCLFCFKFKQTQIRQSCTCHVIAFVRCVSHQRCSQYVTFSGDKTPFWSKASQVAPSSEQHSVELKVKKLQTHTGAPNLLTAAANHRPSDALSLLLTVSHPKLSGITT